VLTALGVRPPKEFPFDLAVSALALLLPAAYGLLALWMAVDVPRDVAAILGEFLPAIRSVWLVVAGCVLVVVLLRLGWLCRTWLRRQFGRAWRFLPFEVRIRAGEAAAKVEKPVGLRLLVSSALLAFFGMLNLFGPIGATYFDSLVFTSMFVWAGWLLISLPWWYRINRELRDLDRTYDSHRASSRPLASVVMIALGCSVAFPPYGWAVAMVSIYLPFIAAFRLGRHIRRAQQRAGQRAMVLPPWIVALGLLIPQVSFAYLQKELNRLWAVEGQPLDPWPAALAPEATDSSTATLPWLKTKAQNRTDTRRQPHLPSADAPPAERAGATGANLHEPLHV
jgi:hypothetical protein